MCVCFLFSGMNNLIVCFEETYLEDDQTLGFYNIQPSSTLRLGYFSCEVCVGSKMFYAIFIVPLNSILRIKMFGGFNSFLYPKQML